MASARTAPRGEFVCKHFRALARGVARMWESHVSWKFLQATNECADALAVQLSALPEQIEHKSSSRAGSRSSGALSLIDYTARPELITRHAFAKVSIHPIDDC